MKILLEKENVMSYDEFCLGLDKREQENPVVCYSDEERKFLWDEIAQKSRDVQDAILEWVETGRETELSIPDLELPDDFWNRPLAKDVSASSVPLQPISAKSLMESHDMNYIAAAFTIDWIRRKPLEAIMTLRGGMI